MKNLLITNYWYPWNNSGAFRWLHLSEYIDIHTVLTTRETKGFKDETMPVGKCGKLLRINCNFPVLFNGIVLAVISCFIRADRYIYTCPPETLLVGAFINQLLGRKVYVDMRDKIDRHTQPNKWLIPIYQWLYKRIKNVCVCMSFFDPEKTVIRHGYDNIVKHGNSPSYIETHLRLKYSRYCKHLSDGVGRYYGPSYIYAGYNSSSVVTLRHLGNPIKGAENLHPECFEFKPEPWKQIAEKMKQFLQLS